jgi:DNA anti-recombination protein RmuC
VNWIILATAVLGFLSAALAALQGRQNKAKIAEVHVLVNSQFRAVLDRVAQLTGTLEQAGVAVPEAGHDVPPLPGAPPGS